MSPADRFLLDASVFIQAHRAYYAFDICPGFWSCLVQNQATSRMLSIDHVRRELLAGKDPLADWVRNALPAAAFASTGEKPVARAFGEIMAWVQAQPKFLPAAKAEFADGADGWLVAYAKAEGLVVVTQEVYDENVRRRVPIPNVCRQFGVNFIGTYDMLRAFGAKFQ